jgi:hypothetical protein
MWMMCPEEVVWSLVAVAYVIGILSGMWAGYCIYRAGEARK